MSVFRRILMSGIIDLPESQIFRYKADSKITFNNYYDPFNGKVIYHKYDPNTGEGEIGNNEDIIAVKSRAFTKSNIGEVYIPEKCETIESDSFGGISKIYLNENLKNLQENFYSTGESILEIHITNLETWFDVDFRALRDYELYFNDEKITNLVIPESVTTLKEYAFQNCVGLESVTIGDNVKKIKSYSFYRCDNLTNVVLGNGVEEIEEYAFRECDKLPVYNDGVYADTLLISCSGNLEDIKEGTKFIGSNCFINSSYNVLKYDEIILPNSIIGVGNGAFNYHDINKLIIPDSVQYLGKNAFNKVKEIEIGSGLKKLYGNSISVHNIIEKITILNNNNFDSRNDCNAIIETSTDTLIMGTNTTIIPDNIKHIGSYAFTNCSFIDDELVIPEGVITIGDEAFYETDIYSVEIPDSVTTIGKLCFYNCNKLMSVILGNGIANIGESAFYSTYLLKEIKCYNKKAPTVGSYCFNDYRSGFSPTLFYPYGSDYSSWFTNNVFYNDHMYRIACLDENLYNYELDGWDLAVIIVSNGENTKLFNDGTTGITNVQVDNINIESISSTYNFNDVNKEHLVRFNFENSKIPDQIFKWIAVVSCKIKEGITEIGTGAFYATSHLVNVCNLPDSLTVINNNAFNGCKIKHLNCPNIEYIGNYAFSSNFLKTVQLSDKTTTIKEYAFFESSNLRKVVLGANVKEVGRMAFCECSSLTDITFVSENIEFGDEVFKDCDNLPVYEGGRYADTYLVFYFYGNKTFNIKEGTKYIGDNAFENSDIEGDIYLPDSVTHIYNEGFRNIENITSIRLGKNIKHLGQAIFTTNDKMTKIICESVVPPTISFDTFYEVASSGKLYYPKGSDYSSWFSKDLHYLGYKNWTGVETEFE